jgi:hypothetical protein
VTIYKPVKLFVLGVALLACLVVALNPVLTDGWLTLVAIIGFWAVMAGVFGCLVWTDGEPQPVTSQLQVSHVRVIDTRSHETVP